MMIHLLVKLIIRRFSSGNSCQLSSFYLENLNTYIDQYIKSVTCCFMWVWDTGSLREGHCLCVYWRKCFDVVWGGNKRTEKSVQ